MNIPGNFNGTSESHSLIIFLPANQEYIQCAVYFNVPGFPFHELMYFLNYFFSLLLIFHLIHRISRLWLSFIFSNSIRLHVFSSFSVFETWEARQQWEHGTRQELRKAFPRSRPAARTIDCSNFASEVTDVTDLREWRLYGDVSLKGGRHATPSHLTSHDRLPKSTSATRLKRDHLASSRPSLRPVA